LDGYVFVNSGQTLTIEPGTVVKGMAGQGADAAALIVARGGMIDAEGTADCGITFTFEADDLDGATPYNTTGQWGGVILLGDAPTNLPTGEGQIEGVPADNDRAAYGGANANDNSGVLRYVSIRHGGTQLGAANEINGLTLGGVGAGTTIDHIEVLSNEDDGIEFFGGTVEINYAAVAFVGDDSFDWDQGFSGGGSFWFNINDPAMGDRGGELDGDDSPDVTADGMPFAIPSVTNWTMIGRGPAAGKQGMLFRAGTGGHISNAIIAGFAEGIEIEDVQNPSDAFDKWSAGDLTLNNIEFDNVTEIIDYDGTAVADGDAQLDAYAAANSLVFSNTGIDYDWSANASGTAFTNPFNPAPTTGTNNGAFINGNNWLAGNWSYLDVSGAAVANFSLYQITLSLSAGTYSYEFHNEAGASDGMVRTVTIDASMEVAPVCFGSETACDGCIDPEYADFNPHAGTSVDCLVDPVLGCTYADATNYDATPRSKTAAAINGILFTQQR
jgi:hypothetical protein